MTEKPRKGEPPNKWRALFSIAAAQFIDFGKSAVLSAMFPLIRRSLQLNVGHLGTISAAKQVVGPIFTPTWGMVPDRYSRKGVLVWAKEVGVSVPYLSGFPCGFLQLGRRGCHDDQSRDTE